LPPSLTQPARSSAGTDHPRGALTLCDVAGSYFGDKLAKRAAIATKRRTKLGVPPEILGIAERAERWAQNRCNT